MNYIYINMNVNVVDQTHNSCLLSVCILLDTLPSGKIFRNVLATYITLLCVTGSIKRYFKRTSIITKNIYTLLLLANLTIHMRYAEHWSSMPINIICYVDNVSVLVFASFKPLFLAYIFLYNIFTIFSYIPEQFVSSQLTANIM